jgi:hypothetical protein
MIPPDAPEEDAGQPEGSAYAGRWIASLGGEIISQGVRKNKPGG